MEAAKRDAPPPVYSKSLRKKHWVSRFRGWKARVFRESQLLWHLSQPIDAQPNPVIWRKAPQLEPFKPYRLEAQNRLEAWLSTFQKEPVRQYIQSRGFAGAGA